MIDLARHIKLLPMADTHNHQRNEAQYLAGGPDVLEDLLSPYLQEDLRVAGASEESLKRALDSSNRDVEGRFAGIRQAWERCRYTGYGEAARWMAREVYGMEEMTAEGLAAAQGINARLRQPGERLRILRERANLHHLQIDNFSCQIQIDSTAPDFYLHDLSWMQLSLGQIQAEKLHQATGITVTNLATLREALTAICARQAALAVAVKSQHAYGRTLLWRQRSEAEAEAALGKVLGSKATEEDRLCLGDWCLARGVELAGEHDLPFKIHTGYLTFHGTLDTERVRAGHLCGIIRSYPRTRFVLMHLAFPNCAELIGMAKNHPNVAIDFCWAWAAAPLVARDFLRQLIHSVPWQKIFAFGGDTFWPTSTLACAVQARRWLHSALRLEIEEGLLAKKEAMHLATRIMQENQTEYFHLAEKQAALRQAAAQGENP